MMSVGGGIIIGLLVVWFITTAAAIISFERWYRAKYTKKRKPKLVTDSYPVFHEDHTS